MNLSKDTIQILKNFSAINDNILILPGNIVKTKAMHSGHIYAEAEIEEDFPKGFGIYDLSSFLPIISSFDSPNISFSKKENEDGLSAYSVIKDKTGKSSFQFNGSVKRVLDFPDKSINLPEMDFEFEITEEQLDQVRRMCNVAQLNKIVISSDGNEVTVSVLDTELQSSNQFTLTIDAEVDEFRVMLSEESVQCLIPGSYSFSTDGEHAVVFKNLDKKLKYIIATEDEE